jgi:hypothetical protein
VDSTITSADDHSDERSLPTDLWTSRAPAKRRARVPPSEHVDGLGSATASGTVPGAHVPPRCMVRNRFRGSAYDHHRSPAGRRGAGAAAAQTNLATTDAGQLCEQMGTGRVAFASNKGLYSQD